ncbi:MAG: chemotaxis protein CheA [Deltaproteobacteria bacterium]|nr:chemotaxis protein CheA [Deltaproteobacteria bacterium]
MYTDESIIHEFVVESMDMIDQIEPKLIEISNQPAHESADFDTIHTVFRLFHSMKGSAGFMNLKTVQSVTHETETFLDLVRNGKIGLTNEHINLLFRVCDFLRVLLDKVDTNLNDQGAESESVGYIEDLRLVISQATDEISGNDSGRNVQGEINENNGMDSGMGMESQGGFPPRNDMDSVFEQARGAFLNGPPSSPPAPATPSPQTKKEIQPASDEDDRLLKMVLSPEMLEHFLRESAELMDTAEQNLLELEKNPDNPENISEVFRNIHSFKGNCGMMGFNDLERLSHKMETFLECIKDGILVPEKHSISLVLNLIDILRNGLNDLAKDGPGKIMGLEALLELIDEALPEEGVRGMNKLIPAKTASSPVEKKIASAPPQRMVIPPAPAPKMNIPPAAPQNPQSSAQRPGLMAGAGPVQNQPRPLQQAQPVPGPQVSKPQPPRPTGTNPARQPAVGQHPPVGASPPAPPPQGVAAQPSTMQPPKTTRRDDGLYSPAKPLVPPKVMVELDKKNEGALQAAILEKQHTVIRKDIRVDLEKLDVLIDLVGELIIAESMVSQNPDLVGYEFERFEKAANHLNKITREIQDIAMALRMVPLSTVFRKMIRLVHDLSQKSKKEVDLVLRGEETEVDKTVIELISDPLVHMIRNSVDHGIEPVEERLARRKPAKGTISIEARHEGGEVWVIVKDDGRGLNREKLLAKGIERGLVKGDGSDWRDEDVYRLIFEPGFSTASQVTDVSGRGVGMDVVKRNLERIKGRIDIFTVEKKGSRFTLRIPLTLAIIEGMLIRVGDRRYIIPMTSIRESIMIQTSDITETMDGQEIIMLRGNLYPVVRLHELHKITPVHTKLEDGLLMVMEHQGTTFCLFVDELLGQLQTVIKGLSGILGQVRGVSGCAILGDGDVSLILDVGTLIEMASIKEIDLQAVN